MKYAENIDGKYELKRFDKSYETTTMAPGAIVRYNSEELKMRVELAETLFSLVYGELENRTSNITLEDMKKMEPKKFKGVDALDTLVAYSKQGKKEKKRRIESFELKYDFKNYNVIVSNGLFACSDIKGLLIAESAAPFFTAGTFASLTLPIVAPFAFVAGGYLLVDGCIRKIRNGDSSGMRITIESDEKVDLKSAMKHNALCTVIEKYNPAKPKNILNKLEAEIAQIDSLGTKELTRRKSIEQLKGAINKTGKGNKRKNILKEFK